MKRFVPVFAVILGWASVVWAAAPAPLTTLRDLHALSNAQASQSLPVAFEATVTFFRPSERSMFVQDGDVAIFVLATPDANVVSGDRVLVVGKTTLGFHPDVTSDHITLLHHGALPKPVPATFDELIRTKYDCRLVTVRGVIRSVDLETRKDTRNASLPMHTLARALLLMDGGYVEVFIESSDANTLSSLLDAEVEATGVSGATFNGKMELRGAQISISTLANVKILKHAEVNPWSLPVRPMDQILPGFHVRDLTQRIRIHGTITYYNPGSAMVIQDGTTSTWIATRTRIPLQIGDEADAIGFPDTRNDLLSLNYGEIQDSHIQKPIQPLTTTWEQLSMSGHLYDLISIDGQVVTAVREASQDEYVVNADGHLFTAIYRHPDQGPPPMKQIPPGSRVRVTGICIQEGSNQYLGKVPFNILLRSFDDITVVGKPSLLNIHNLIIVLGLLLLVVVIVGTWGWILKRKVHSQTGALATMAQFEQRRSHILEDINGSKPLAKILEEITEMGSFMLHGAPCWCEIMDGARLGKRPLDVTRLRVHSVEIPARSGPALGTLFAAFDPETPPAITENETLSTGVKLASLAMENRRLYSDLRRRSEFDLLTDIQNRFSLEKKLHAQINEARKNAGVFGLIYIDLDEFKRVNDQYGHRIGDVYLQEVAERMKQQLRFHDLLARLGGDEFAVLLPLGSTRTRVEEIAHRLGHCFDALFNVEGISLQGSASIGIAMYPEDSATGDSLLNVADTAMYVVKNSRKQATSRSLSV
jgi:diguanylate cyclase (GGDEF)-like protein